MERSRVILVGLVLALIGVIVPIALMAWLSWGRAVEYEEVRLEAMANRVIDRANLSVSEATETLKQISVEKVTPCSAEHIQLMRRMTVNTRSVEEVGFFQNHFLRCTSWGQVTREVRQERADITIATGVEVTSKMRPMISGGNPVMALQYGAYNALISIDRFVDVVVDSGVHLALARADGLLVAESQSSHWAFVRQILAQDGDIHNELYFYKKVVRDGWIGVAIGDRRAIFSDLRRQLLWLLPLGFFIGIFILGLVVRFSHKRLSLESELALAIRRRQFVVHYQPIMELKTGRCVGAEALVRWRRSNGVLVAPDLFIPLAEKSGLILAITDQVIASVVQELKEVLVADRSLHVAINLCADDIKTGRVLPIISAALAQTGIRAEQIWLEATESGFVDIDSAKATLAWAREMGHSTAIDDFGTGFSSLQYLQGLPLDALKIDKSFVDTIGTGAVSSSVIAHIIEMAKSLGLFIVAEGVETSAQSDYLAERGVDFVQGWRYSKALPALEFLDFYHQAKVRVGAGPSLIRREISSTASC